MPDYSQGKIYKLVCNKTGKIYFGSTTTKYLSKRKGDHQAKFKKYREGKHHYVSSFSVLENGDFSMELVEEYPCRTKEELMTRERHFIEHNECVNMLVPMRTMSEYRKNNPDMIRRLSKNYYERNREAIIEYQRNYKRNNPEKIKELRSLKIECDCGVSLSKSDVARHKRTKKHQDYEKNII